MSWLMNSECKKETQPQSDLRVNTKTHKDEDIYVTRVYSPGTQAAGPNLKTYKQGRFLLRIQ